MVVNMKSRVDLTPPTHTREGLANEIIFPGHVVEYLSTGKVQKNDRAGDLYVAKMIAMTKDYDGQGTSAGDHGDYSYQVNDNVIIGYFPTGAEVLLRVAAGAAAIVFGDLLGPVANGTVAKLAAATNIPFAIATEAIDNSAGGGEVYIRAIVI